MGLRKKIFLRSSIAMFIVGSLLWVGPSMVQVAGASPPQLSACTANEVKVDVSTSDLSNGQVLQTFRLTNIGSVTCGMEGYPGLTFFTNTKLDTYVSVHHHASVYSSIPPRLLAIGPGSVVAFGLTYQTDSFVKSSDERDCDVTNLLLLLPSSPSSTGDFSLHESFNACHSGNVVDVTAVENRSTPRLSAQ